MDLAWPKNDQQMYKYVQLAHIYFGGSEKYFSKWINTYEKEIITVN